MAKIRKRKTPSKQSNSDGETLQGEEGDQSHAQRQPVRPWSSVSTTSNTTTSRRRVRPGTRALQVWVS